MSNIGRKILSAFVEVTEEDIPVATPEAITKRSTKQVAPVPVLQQHQADTATAEKFKQYFEKLFKDANLPGPDYFEFSKMTEAMISIPDERTRYTAAFAGLNIQGLDKQKLLHSATQYVQVLETDAANFNSTVDAALKEKVQGKQQEIEAKQQRIADISREITDLQNQIQLLQQEVKENEEKIDNNSSGYTTASENMKKKILYDVEKIKQHIA